MRNSAGPSIVHSWFSFTATFSRRCSPATLALHRKMMSFDHHVVLILTVGNYWWSCSFLIYYYNVIIKEAVRVLSLVYGIARVLSRSLLSWCISNMDGEAPVRHQPRSMMMKCAHQPLVGAHYGEVLFQSYNRVRKGKGRDVKKVQVGKAGGEGGGVVSSSFRAYVKMLVVPKFCIRNENLGEERI